MERERVKHTADRVPIDQRHYATNAWCVVRAFMRMLDIPPSLLVKRTDRGRNERVETSSTGTSTRRVLTLCGWAWRVEPSHT